MTPLKSPKRFARATLLIVAEGDAEVAFLKHIKSLYAQDLGRSITIKNAYGKGGRHVLEMAIRISRALKYGKTVLVLDNDVNWSDRERREAERAKIKVVESSPCLEATLLKITGSDVEGTTVTIKEVFYDTFGCEAHEDGYLEEHFKKNVLDDAREVVLELGSLMNHMGIPKRRGN